MQLRGARQCLEFGVVQSTLRGDALGVQCRAGKVDVERLSTIEGLSGQVVLSCVPEV